MSSVVTSLMRQAFKKLKPRTKMHILPWVRRYVRTYEGRPYDHGAYPHLGAPGGPFDAFMDPEVKTIWLQFATRCGKTFFGCCCLLFTGTLMPCPMMFVGATEKLSIEVVGRIYKMIERCKPLAGQLRPPSRRKQNQIDLQACRIWVAWARSASTLADKPVKTGLASEIDKYEHEQTSKEADPLKLFDDRFKEYPSHKKIKESTPTVRGKSRIEAGRLNSTNCSYYVPCPHCEQYQKITFEQIKWHKEKDSHSDPDVARKTAYYECEHCHQKIEDHHRGPMMRLGVWVPEGCQIEHENALRAAKEWGKGEGEFSVFKGWEKAPWISGKPSRNGSDAGYQLSSFYALSLGWGAIAEEFVKCHRRPQDLRNFINSWKADTWEQIRKRQAWHELADKLIDTSLPRFVVPDWATLLTIGIDRQGEPDRFPWVIDAWGPGRRSHTIAYGESPDFQSLADLILDQQSDAQSRQLRRYEIQDTSETLTISCGLIDSGFRPSGVYEFAREMKWLGADIYPSKGSNRALKSDYEPSVLGPNTSMPGMTLYHIDTIRSQLEIERKLHAIAPGEEGADSVHAGSSYEHQNYLEQLLNDAPITKLDNHNNSFETWDRIDTSVPNDYRDCKRYSYVAMLLKTRGGPILARSELHDSNILNQSTEENSSYRRERRW